MRTPEEIADAVAARYAARTAGREPPAALLRAIVAEEVRRGSPNVPGSLDDDTARLIATTLGLSTEGEVTVYRYVENLRLHVKISRKTAGPGDVAPTGGDVALSEDDATLHRNARRWLLLLLAERAHLLRLLADDRLADTAAREMGRREGREEAEMARKGDPQ